VIPVSKTAGCKGRISALSFSGGENLRLGKRINGIKDQGLVGDMNAMGNEIRRRVWGACGKGGGQSFPPGENQARGPRFHVGKAENGGFSAIFRSFDF